MTEGCVVNEQALRLQRQASQVLARREKERIEARRDRLRERVGHLVYLMNEWRRADTRTFDESLAIGPVLHADHLADQIRATLYQLLEIE